LILESRNATLNVRWIVLSLTAVASASFIYLALFSEQKWLRTILTNRFLVYTGVISYGMYLLQKIPLDVVKSSHLSEYPLAAFLVATVATYALATLSWNLLEKPFLALKRFFKGKNAGGPMLATESLAAAERS
jgi:peptidoglycan/LPS O-acetylase OafA/YrhL